MSSALAPSSGAVPGAVGTNSTAGATGALPFALPALKLDDTLGAIVIAEIMVCVLFGIASIQAYTYFTRSARDSAYMKGIITLLWLLGTLYFIFTSHAAYHYTVTHFMDPAALLQVPWSLAAVMVLGDLIESTVTGVFAYRIYKLSRSWALFALPIPSQLGSWIVSIIIGVLIRKYPSYTDLEDKYAGTWYALYSLQAAADCTIAATLCTILFRRRTGFKRTDSLIKMIILYSVNTCALTSSVSVAAIITYAIMPHNLIFVALACALPMLMWNSLLALLNSRDVLRDMHSAPGPANSVHLAHLAGLVPASAQSQPQGSQSQGALWQSNGSYNGVSYGAGSYETRELEREGDTKSAEIIGMAMRVQDGVYDARVPVRVVRSDVV